MFLRYLGYVDEIFITPLPDSGHSGECVYVVTVMPVGLSENKFCRQYGAQYLWYFLFNSSFICYKINL